MLSQPFIKFNLLQADNIHGNNKIEWTLIFSMMNRGLLIILLTLVTEFSVAHHYDILVLGDEISAEEAELGEKIWIEQAKETVNCKLRIRNLSKPGTTSKDAMPLLQSFYDKNTSRVTVIELGGNDAQRGYPITHLQRNLDALISLAREKNTHVILVGIDLPPQYGTIYRQMLKTTFERTAHNHSVTLIATDYANDPNLVQTDGVHPNTQGHARIASLIAPYLEQTACHHLHE